MLVAAAWLMVGAPAWADEADAKAKKMEGTWTVTASSKDGKKAANADIKDKTVKITKDTITCLDKDGKTEQSFSYTVDTSGKPWTITMTGKDGDLKDKKVKGIVELDGDTLKICHAKPDKDAPTKIADAEGCCCYTLTRSK